MFPAPMTVPGHELALDPSYPPQPVHEWLEADYRNEVTPARNTIYVAAPPKVSNSLSYVDQWTSSTKDRTKEISNKVTPGGDTPPTPAPSMADVVEYLQAFYHGMKVKLLTDITLEWIAWESSKKPRKSSKTRGLSQTPTCIGLSNGKEIVRVESRPSPDGTFSGQLNQSHLLDVAIDILPNDAYALLMLVHHDLFEDEDDDFCCGRAYGGSRVAVVSTARYRPELDAKQKIDLEHVWPASHCARHVSGFFSNKMPTGPAEEQEHYRNAIEFHPGSALASAVVAHVELPLPSSPAERSALWLGRICKTASHELAHCFGIDHCVYFACSMQGTAHIAEDHRQPPYLCPVDLSKVLRATGADEKARYEALLQFCGRWQHDRMFAAYGEWIKAALGHYELSS
jgi:archaemetzincin